MFTLLDGSILFTDSDHITPSSFAACQCFGHTDKCVYDEEVDNLGISLDIHGNYEGGGVCLDCQDNTMGTNCDKCVPGYYRPRGRSLYDRDVCEGTWPVVPLSYVLF